MAVTIADSHDAEVYHPAKYNDKFLPIFARILEDEPAESVLDPMAGVGKIGNLRDHGFKGRIVANELELEWATQTPSHVELHIGDAANMKWAASNEFDAIIVSPTYGNRMADHHEAKDGSRRYTYRHSIGRPLHEANTGQMQWGEEYCEAHRDIWAECIRVLRRGGIFVLNVKNHIRGGKIIPVSEWHMATLFDLGLRPERRIQVDTPGMRRGENSRLRVTTEDIWCLRKEWFTL
jgi:tRNA G10  N-methylase Trm11